MPVSISSWAADRCAVEPGPCVANVSLPGLALAWAISSCNEAAGSDLRTASTFGIFASMVIGTKSDGA
jgi:hypothetical protein